MTDTAQRDAKDGWEKLKIATGAIAAIAVPVVIAVMGSAFNAAMKSQEVQLRMTEMSLDILKTDPRVGGQPEGLREWAVEVLEQQSGVRVSSALRRALLERPLNSFESTVDALLAIIANGPPHEQSLAASALKLIFIDRCAAGDVEFARHVLESAEAVEGANVPGLLHVDSIDATGRSGLIHAALNNHLDLASFLVEDRGADVNLGDGTGLTPLIGAVLNDHIEMVRYLAGVDGLDPNRANNTGDTALIIAVSLRRLEIVPVILQIEGLDLEVANDTGDTALDVARERALPDIEQQLRAAGAAH